ncbi:MAG: aldehyde dehydrogenase family protein, partial [Longispora sp.]|nr:aldehyde dehydrogenase family protein [Longispora sp. (in: high G+C Gram-positive bacteria)]
MTMDRATGIPGTPMIDDGWLISTHPVTGAEAGRFPIADAEAVAAAVTRARAAAEWWRSLGFDGRRRRLLAWRSDIVRRLDELVAIMRAETGKPVTDATLEISAAVEHIAWAAKHAPRVLSAQRVGGSFVQLEFSAWVEYQPYGVVGVIGPWNYPVYTPMGSIAYAMAAGNAVVFKPSEYTPAVGQFLVDAFARVVPEHPVLQIVHGIGSTGEALVRSAVDKIAFTGSTNTGKRVMAAASDNLTPVLLECGGKDAMIVEADADLDAAAQAAVWAGMANAGQTCVGIERVYAVEPIFDRLVEKIVAKASALKVGSEPDDDIGPVTMPGQIEVIERHITAALKDGGTAVLGGIDAVRAPFVHPT